MSIDVQLVRLAKEGDSESFAKLYECMAGELYKIALYTLGNTFDAQDVVSEAFFEGYKSLANLRDDNAFKPWMLRILSFRCKRKIGQYVKDKSVLDIDEYTNLIEDRTDMETASVEKTELMDALSTLSDDERQIVVMSAVEGYTAREIANIVGAPIGTISSKLYRSLAKLRLILDK